METTHERTREHQHAHDATGERRATGFGAPTGPDENGAAARVLVVDDDPFMLSAVEHDLAASGYSTRSCRSGTEALQALESEEFDVILTDLKMPRIDGVELCDRVVGNDPTTPVVVMTAYGEVDVAVAATRAGAFDFIRKPFSEHDLLTTIRRALSCRDSAQIHRLRPSTPPGRPSASGIVGSSPEMTRVIDQAHRVAESDCSVLITGESGTGKELVARALHDLGVRRNKPFVAVNCAAIPHELLESELFGHVRGAFTGASTSHQGLFVSACGGTLLLDEVAAMPLQLQPKLLRVLQDQRVRPVGGSRETSFDVRVLAATNRDLRHAVREGSFREDLLYRLDVVTLDIPPLRERGQDVIELAEYFLRQYATHAVPYELTEEARSQLLAYPWPGNVRELQNCVQSAIVFARDGRVGVEDLPESIRHHKASPPTRHPEAQPLTLDAVEREHIESVLHAVGGNKARAAEALGIDRTTLYRKLKRYRLDARCS